MMGRAEELGRLLAGIRRRRQRASSLATTGYASAAAALPVAVFAVLVQLTGASGAWLVSLVLLALVGVVLAVGLARWRRQARPDDRQIARFVGERAPDPSGASVGDALASAVEVMHGSARTAGAFDALVIHRAVALLRGIDPRAVVPAREVRRAALAASTGIALLLTAVGASAPHVQRAAGTVWLAMFPQSIEIAVLTGDARLRGGQPLRIAASISGRGARWLAAPPSLVIAADGQQASIDMAGADGAFEHTFDVVDRSFAYRVTAGRAVSREHTVTVLYPPRVTRIDVHYRYPAFTGLAPRQDVDSGDIYGPAGSAVRVVVHADKPIASGSLALDDGTLVALAAEAEASASADLRLERDGGYRVGLVDVDGLASRGDVEYFIRIMNDRPPDVRIVRPAADQGIMPLQEVVIEARAGDDHGIASFDLVYTVVGREPRTVPFTRLTGTDTARTGFYLLEAEALGVQPGDVITYYARARDVPRGRRSIEARSDIFFLEVKPFSEEFVAAQSQAMGGGSSGTQIDGLIAAQKEIISATWNLERRSAAGRSAEDLEAVGRAQAELKARAERMLVRSGGGRGGFLPQQVQPRSTARTRGGAEHVGAAVEAMGLAVEALERQRTADAIPHEAAALQALLRAQAEVRRRQVLQQAAGMGAGGSSRSDRDLSTLFDRELQRQQRTVYETPPQAAPEEPPAPDDVADRLRDLATRQEELAARQRELRQSARSPEEARRQLERLSREQQEIRRQLEEMARRSDAQRGASGSGQGSGMQEAAEAVRRAAEAAARQNAEDAAAHGARAAEALRQAERQARGGAGARQRAAGGLQQDARHLAATQRRLAADAARLAADADRTGPAGTDARRRLSDEQERLAARVDALERAARSLARDGQEADRTRLTDALGHLQDEQIAQRMRAGAERIRNGLSRGQAASPGDADIARALDVLADKLGGAPDGTGRQAAGDLERSRQLREQLDRLERQVREAEAQVRDAAGAAGTEGQRAAEAERELTRAREAYARGLERVRESLGRLDGGLGGWTPEQHEFSRSAPGTEAFKQDFSEWESLRRDLDRAIEHHEAAAITRLRERARDDRLEAGGSHAVPDAYRPAVSRYFEALARTRK